MCFSIPEIMNCQDFFKHKDKILVKRNLPNFIHELKVLELKKAGLFSTFFS